MYCYVLLCLFLLASSDRKGLPKERFSLWVTGFDRRLSPLPGLQQSSWDETGEESFALVKSFNGVFNNFFFVKKEKDNPEEILKALRLSTVRTGETGLEFKHSSICRNMVDYPEEKWFECRRSLFEGYGCTTFAWLAPNEKGVGHAGAFIFKMKDGGLEEFDLLEKVNFNTAVPWKQGFMLSLMRDTSHTDVSDFRGMVSAKGTWQGKARFPCGRANSQENLVEGIKKGKASFAFAMATNKPSPHQINHYGYFVYNIPSGTIFNKFEGLDFMSFEIIRHCDESRSGVGPTVLDLSFRSPTTMSESFDDTKIEWMPSDIPPFTDFAQKIAWLPPKKLGAGSAGGFLCKMQSAEYGIQLFDLE